MRIRRLLLLPITLGLLAAPAAAQTPNCVDLPNVSIGAGGSASVPLLSRLGASLARVSPAAPPITIVYQSPGACFGITSILDATGITGTASYWDETGAQRDCALPATGLIPNFAMLGTDARLCEGVDALPANVGDFPGPITSWSLIVPQASSQQAISAQAAYFIYGFGPVEGQVAPWIDPAHLWGRNATSAALIAIALGARVPPERMASWFPGDRDVRTNGRMVERVVESGAVAPEAALGFVSTEVADANRATVRTLAFQAWDQACSYWPDSAATAFDKRNVRDGHYELWTAYHFYVPVDGSRTITHAATRQLVGYFTGTAEPPSGVSINDIIIDNGNIPECAMQVWRDEDIGPLYSYLPEAPCGCYYDFAATGSSDCTACLAPSDCPSSAPVCRFGFCEVR